MFVLTVYPEFLLKLLLQYSELALHLLHRKIIFVDLTASLE